MTKRYRYVGPAQILQRALGQPGGSPIAAPDEILAWAKHSGQSLDPAELLAATFVIDADERLLLADRRSEHLACASGGEILSAGEIFFAVDGAAVSVAEISNQSTGYCPEPESWTVVERVLNAIGLGHPGGFTTVCVFRRCSGCGERNIVKDGWYQCDVCGRDLDRRWNFG
jgi:hypothetical protein